MPKGFLVISWGKKKSVTEKIMTVHCKGCESVFIAPVGSTCFQCPSCDHAWNTEFPGEKAKGIDNPIPSFLKTHLIGNNRIEPVSIIGERHEQKLELKIIGDGFNGDVSIRGHFTYGDFTKLIADVRKYAAAMKNRTQISEKTIHEKKEPNTFMKDLENL